MRTAAVLVASAAMSVLACGADDTPTQPDHAAEPSPAIVAYAQAANTWAPRAPLPFLNEVGVSAGVVTTTAGQSTVYTFGGIEGIDGGVDWPVQAYDVATDTWTVKTSVVHGSRLNGVGKIGGRLYFSGGYITHAEDHVRQLYAYDYANDRLLPKQNMPNYTSDGITGVVNGKLYVLPGICGGEFWPATGYCDLEPFRKLYRYDPTTDAWTKMGWCPHFHARGAGGVINGKFYVVAGFGIGHAPNASLDEYDPATNTWRTRAPLPAASDLAYGAVLNGKLYVVASTASGGATYAYTPGTNSWARKATPKYGHSALVPVSLSGKNYLFAVGGGSEVPNELYAP
jgi:N-acetylneuraminic acid mutarotase